MATVSEKSISYHTNNGKTLVYELEDTSNYGISLSSVPSEIVTTETFVAEEHVLPCVETATVIPPTVSSSSLSSSTDNKLCHHLPMEIDERMKNCLHASAEIISSLSKDHIPTFYGYTTPYTNPYSLTPVEYKDDPESSSEDESDYTDQRGLEENIDEDFAILEDFATVLEESESVFEEVDDYTEDFDDFIMSNDEVIQVVHEVEYNLEWPVVADVISGVEELQESHQFLTESEELLPSPAAFSTSSWETVIERRQENLKSVEESGIKENLEEEDKSAASPKTVSSLIQFFENVAHKSRECTPSPKPLSLPTIDNVSYDCTIEETEDCVTSPVHAIPAFVSRTLLHHQDPEQSVLFSQSLHVSVENEASIHFSLCSHPTMEIPSEGFGTNEPPRFEENAETSCEPLSDSEPAPVSSLELLKNDLEFSSSSTSQKFLEGSPEHEHAHSSIVEEHYNVEDQPTTSEIVTFIISARDNKLENGDNASSPKALQSDLLTGSLQEFSNNHQTIVEKEDYPIPNECFEKAASTSSDSELMDLIIAYVQMVLHTPHHLISTIGNEEAPEADVAVFTSEHEFHMDNSDKETTELAEDVNEKREICLPNVSNDTGCDGLSEILDETETSSSQEQGDESDIAEEIPPTAENDVDETTTSYVHEVSLVPSTFPEFRAEAQDQTIQTPETASAMTVEENGNKPIVSECLISESADVIECFLGELIQIVAENNSDHHSTTTTTDTSMPLQDFPNSLPVASKKEESDLVEENIENVDPDDFANNFTSSTHEDSGTENLSSSNQRDRSLTPVNTVLAPRSNHRAVGDNEPVLVHSLDLTDELPSIPIQTLDQSEPVNDSVPVDEEFLSINIAKDEEQNKSTDKAVESETALRNELLADSNNDSENVNREAKKEHDSSVDVSEASADGKIADIPNLSSLISKIDDQVDNDSGPVQQLEGQQTKTSVDQKETRAGSFTIPTITLSLTDNKNEEDDERVEMMRQAVLRSKSIIEEKICGVDGELLRNELSILQTSDSKTTEVESLSPRTVELKSEEHEKKVDSLTAHQEDSNEEDSTQNVEIVDIDELESENEVNLENGNGHSDDSNDSLKDTTSPITNVLNPTIVEEDSIELKKLAPDTTTDAINITTDMSSSDLDQSPVQVETSDDDSSNNSDTSHVDISCDSREISESENLSDFEEQDAPEVTDCDHSETETLNDGNAVLDQEENSRGDLNENDRGQIVETLVEKNCASDIGSTQELSKTGSDCDAGENGDAKNDEIVSTPPILTGLLPVTENEDVEVETTKTPAEEDEDEEQQVNSGIENTMLTEDHIDNSSEQSEDHYSQDEQELIEIKKAADDLVNSILARVIAEMEQKNQSLSGSDTSRNLKEQGENCIEFKLANLCKSDVPENNITHPAHETVPEDIVLEVKDQMESKSIPGSGEVKDKKISETQEEQVIANCQLDLSDTGSSPVPTEILENSVLSEAELDTSTLPNQTSDSQTSGIIDSEIINDSNKTSQDRSAQDEREMFEINKTAAEVVDLVLTKVVGEMEQQNKIESETEISSVIDVKEEEFISPKQEATETAQLTVPEKSRMEVRKRTESISINGESTCEQCSESLSLVSSSSTLSGASSVNDDESPPLAVSTSIITMSNDCGETDETMYELTPAFATVSPPPATIQEATVSPPMKTDFELKSSVIDTEVDAVSINGNEFENLPQEEHLNMVQKGFQDSADVYGDISLDVSKDTIANNGDNENESLEPSGTPELQEPEGELHDQGMNSIVGLSPVKELPITANEEDVRHADILKTASNSELNEAINQNQSVTDLPEIIVPNSESLPAESGTEQQLENAVSSATSDSIEIRLDVKLPDTNDNFVVAVLCPPDCREVLTAPIEEHSDAQIASKDVTNADHKEIEHAVKEIMESVDSLMNALEIGFPQVTASDQSTSTSAAETNVKTTESEQNTTPKSSVSLPDTPEINNQSNSSIANANCFVDLSNLSEHEDVKSNVTRLHQSESGKQSESESDRPTENVPTNDSLETNPQDASMTGESLNTLEQPKPSSVVEEVSYFLTTVAVAALSLGSSSENASGSGSVSNPSFNTDIIEDASKYIRSHPKSDSP